MQTTQIVYKRKPKQSELNEVSNLIPTLDIKIAPFLNTTIETEFDDLYRVKRLSWNWFATLFGDADIRCLALNPGDLDGIGIKDHWGLYSLDADLNHQFYMTYIPGELDERAKHNDFKSNFAWMFCHEYLHGCRWAETRNREKAASDVHDWEKQGKLKYYLAVYNLDYGKKTLLVSLYEKLLTLSKSMFPFTKPTVYQTALKYLGVDASPRDIVDDVVGCAESVTTILREHVKMPIIPGTASLYAFLGASTLFRRVSMPMPGDIIISPTGMGNGKIQGHTGIVGHNNLIMSNDSYTGKWMANYTISTWNARYADKGKLPVVYYTLK